MASWRLLVAVAVVSLIANALIALWLLMGASNDSVEVPEEAEVAASIEFAAERRTLVEDERFVVQLEIADGHAITFPGDESGVLTDVSVEIGDSIIGGHELARLNGRPLWALPVRFPLYRDIEPGATGDDVVELQRALNAVDPELSLVVDGEFGAATQTAVRGRYDAFGVAPTLVTAEDVGLGELEAGVRELEGQVVQLEMDAEAAQTEVEAARLRLDTARVALEDARASVGLVVKKSEIVAVPLDARITEMPVTVGQTITPGDPFLVIGERVVRGSVTVPSVQADHLTVGDKVVPDDPDVGDGTVERVERGGESSSMTVAISFGRAPDEFSAQSIGVTIRHQITATPVLAVPVAAVFIDGEGNHTVRVPTQDGEWQSVGIEIGAIGGGFVEVLAGPIEEGDVILGG